MIWAQAISASTAEVPSIQNVSGVPSLCVFEGKLVAVCMGSLAATQVVHYRILQGWQGRHADVARQEHSAGRSLRSIRSSINLILGMAQDLDAHPFVEVASSSVHALKDGNRSRNASMEVD